MDYASLPAREIERLSRNVAPGAWAVERERPLSTLLGSCVAVCMFDLQARVGGINHFMLPNMRKRAAELGATLTITSEVGKGTRIELRFVPDGRSKSLDAMTDAPTASK